jgi:hypothetical protein
MKLCETMDRTAWCCNYTQEILCVDFFTLEKIQKDGSREASKKAFTIQQTLKNESLILSKNVI